MIRGITDLVYPRFCIACNGRVRQESGHVCWDCLSGVEYVTRPFCSLCGDPVDGKVEHEYLCSVCRRHAPSFDTARSAVRYRGSMATAIRALKYSNSTQVSGDLGRLLGGCVETCYDRVQFDAVTCVPLHRSKEAKRTYNQSGLLGKALAKRLKLRLVTRCLERAENTDTQTGLSMSQRRKNVRGAFEASMPDWIEGRRLLLVDDVMTTGATVDECSRVLKNAGAATVHVVTVARG